MHAGFWCENIRDRYHFKSNHRWEDNIKIYCQEIGRGVPDLYGSG
jgi:hypothetical protein